MSIPTIEAVQALDGRILAMLSQEEQAILNFYQKQGRKFDVNICIINKDDPTICTTAQAMKSSSSLVEVTVGANAQAAWAERAC